MLAVSAVQTLKGYSANDRAAYVDIITGLIKP